jgi:acetyl-CoA carboxylase carboxyl transferase subunit alpha
MIYLLDFEKPIMELERKREELLASPMTDPAVRARYLKAVEHKIGRLRKELYSDLTPWQVVQVARHPRRPYFLDLVPQLFSEFTEIHGDRKFGDDRAMIAGLARFEGRPVIALGNQKGRNLKDNLVHNFGMVNPEGFRKAKRAMLLAQRYGWPVLTFIDTPGAYPGIGAEERGQAEAIADSLMTMMNLTVPIIATVTGEGGSGGALAIAQADRVLMLQFSIYSVISPEACASILWRDRAHAQDAARTLGLTAPTLRELGIIDEIVKEPIGGAHQNPPLAARILRRVIRRHLAELEQVPTTEIAARRRARYRGLGFYKMAKA